jgi:tRNA pseudouridine55 synthase
MARRKGKDVDGILLLDKPLGISSNQALQKIRYLFNAKKAGHTGNLDPLATGVLPICFGQASKVSAFLLDSNKRYTCTAELGTTTTTGDKEGEVLQTREIPTLSKQQVLTVLDQFKGEIQQTPPMYSALKHNGQPLYKLARQGIEVERKARTIHILELNLIEYKSNSITLDVLCTKGTYIRTLAQDIGEQLGCGAHLSQLRRTEVEPFDCTKLYTIEDLQLLSQDKKEKALLNTLLPIDSALIKHPRITLSIDETKRIQNGLKVAREDIPDSAMIRLYQENGAFLGIGRHASDHQLAPKRLMKTGH